MATAAPEVIAARPLARSLAVGALTGLVALLLFASLHAALIVSIWSRLRFGVPFSLLGGAAMGWALYEWQSATGVATTVPRGLGRGALFWGALWPTNLLDLVLRWLGWHQPLGDAVPVTEAALALITGCLLGWLIGRRRRTALAFGIATLGVVAAMGGPVPVLNSRRAATMFAAFLPLLALSGAVFAALAALLGRFGRSA